MSDPEVVFHPAASEEYAEAFGWYAARSEEIADHFAREVETGLAWIVEAPHRWPTLDDTHRKLSLRRFPYQVIYREFAGRLWIVAVAHGHRRPGYWKSRRPQA